MLDKELDSIAKSWLNFLNNNYSLKLIDDNHVVLTTPITDAFDDSITVMLSQNNNHYVVSDQGYTIWNLESRGINVTKKNSNRRQIVDSIIKGEQVNLSDTDEIFKTGSKTDIPQMLFDVIQASTKISNLGLMNPTTVRRVFSEDVNSYLTDNSKQFTFLKGFKLTGKSGLSYKVDYLFPSPITSKVTKVYDGLAKNTVEQLIGVWFDTENMRKSNSNKMEFDIIIPSLIEPKQSEFAESLLSHGIKVLPFDQKDIIIKHLGNTA